MSTQSIAERYFAAWQVRDTDQLAPLLAADVAATGPLGQIDGPDVLTWFDPRPIPGEMGAR